MSANSVEEPNSEAPRGEAMVLRFLSDHNVPESVAKVLDQAGFDVARLRNIMAVDAKDPVVAMAAIQDDRVLISWDRDFGQQRFKSPRYERLSRLAMSGREVNGALRLAATLDVVVFAFRRAAGRPLTVHVGAGRVQLDI